MPLGELFNLRNRKKLVFAYSEKRVRDWLTHGQTDKCTDRRTEDRTDWPTDQPTDRPTDRQTDGPSYRDARMNLINLVIAVFMDAWKLFILRACFTYFLDNCFYFTQGKWVTTPLPCLSSNSSPYLLVVILTMEEYILRSPHPRIHVNIDIKRKDGGKK